MGEKELLPHQLRVIEEKEELLNKIEKLSAFLQTDKAKELSTEEYILLSVQLDYMNLYFSVLIKRIKVFLGTNL